MSASSKLEIIIASKADVGGFSTAEKSLGQLESRGQSAAKGLSTLGTAATVAGGALAIGLGGAVTAAANFESRMSAVKAASGATGSELAGLSAKALEFGAATDLAGIDANDAATAMEQLAKGGVGVSQMAEAAHGALLLASAGEISVAEAADTAVRAMNIFGLSGEQVGHVADVISAGANKSATDVGQLNAAFNQAASVAKGAGLSLEQLTGVLALLAQNGLQGSDAGTSLRTAITRLTAPTKEAAKEMEALGISVFDMNGKTRDFADIADNLKSSLSGLSDEQRDAALQTIFGADAIRVANVLYKEGGTAVRTWTAAVDDAGSAARIGATRNDNLKGSIDQLKASLQTAAIAAGTTLLPQIRELTKHITDAVTWFGNLSPRVQTIAVDAAVGAAGFLLLAGATSKVISITRDLSTAVQDVIGWFAKKEVAKNSLTKANDTLAGSVGKTSGAMKILATAAADTAIALAGALLIWRGLLGVIAEVGQRAGDNAAATQYLAREQQAAALAAAAMGKGNEDLVRIFISSAEAQDFLAGKTQSGIQAWNDYVTRLNAAGENFNRLQPIVVGTGLALGALGAASAQSALGVRGLADGANAAALAMDSSTAAANRNAQAAYGAGLASGAYAAASYDLTTALGQLSGAHGALSGQMGILQPRIDALQAKQKEGIPLSKAESDELATLLEAQRRLADQSGELAAKERAHVLAMAGLNPEYGNATTGVNIFSDAVLNNGAALRGGTSAALDIARGIDTSRQAAGAAAGAIKDYSGGIAGIPPEASTSVTTPGLNDARVGMGLLTGAINAVPKSFTIVASAAIDGALAAIQKLRDNLPHSPAKEGPFRVLPNWDALFDGIAPALDRAKALIDQFGDDTLKKMIETVASISGALKGGVDALNALGTFKAPKAGVVAAFGASFTDFFEKFTTWAGGWEEDVLKQSGLFADAASKAVGLLKSGVDALMALNDFKAPAAAAISNFGAAMTDFLEKLSTWAGSFEADGLDAAVAFAAAAGKVLAIIKDGVEGLNALAGFKRPLDMAIDAFVQSTNVLINKAAQLGVQMDEEFIKAADVWSGAAGKALGVLKTGVDGLMALGDFIRPTTQATDDFVQATNVLINLTAQMGAQMDKDFVKAAQVWADGAGKALSVLGTGVEGLLKLATFVAPSSQAIDAFAAAVAYLVRRFGEVAGQMGTEGVAAAGAFGTAANSALTAAKTGIDAFMALAKLAVPSRQAIDELLAGIQYTVGRMGELADQFGKDGLARAVAFATAAGKVFTTLKDAVDLMVKLEELKELPGEAIQTLLDGVKFAVAKAIDLVAEAQELERQSILFAGAMSRAAGNFAAGVGGSVPISAGAGGGGHTYTSNVTNVNVGGDVYDGARFEDRVVSAIAAGQSRGRL